VTGGIADVLTLATRVDTLDHCLRVRAVIGLDGRRNAAGGGKNGRRERKGVKISTLS
jgi:hypothetical protein